MKSILVFYFPDTSVGRPFLVLWFSTCNISWYSSWGVIKIYKIVLNNTNHLVNYAIVFDVILPLKDWMVCIWITLSVRHIPSIRPDFVAIILATEGCIDSKISAWLHINWAYAVRNFGCCPMSTSCFVGLRHFSLCGMIVKIFVTKSWVSNGYGLILYMVCGSV